MIFKKAIYEFIKVKENSPFKIHDSYEVTLSTRNSLKSLFQVLLYGSDRYDEDINRTILTEKISFLQFLKDLKDIYLIFN